MSQSLVVGIPTKIIIMKKNLRIEVRDDVGYIEKALASRFDMSLYYFNNSFSDDRMHVFTIKEALLLDSLSNFIEKQLKAYGTTLDNEIRQKIDQCKSADEIISLAYEKSYEHFQIVKDGYNFFSIEYLNNIFFERSFIVSAEMIGIIFDEEYGEHTYDFFKYLEVFLRNQPQFEISKALFLNVC